MRAIRIICIGTCIFTALNLEVFAQNSTQTPNSSAPPPQSSANGAPIVALFEDVLPWGFSQNESILTSRHVAFQVFPSSQMGTLDLTQFVKVVLVSDQPDDYYAKLEANDSRFEDYANGGGVLEMHFAAYKDSVIQTTLLPFGLRVSPIYCSNTVTIVDPSDPLLTTPNAITSSELQGWDCSAHGALIGVDTLGLNVVVNNADGPQGPSSAEGPVGAGLVEVTDSPVEWFYGTTHNFNENLLCFGLSGYGDCP